jgi:hypothetical protein
MGAHAYEGQCHCGNLAYVFEATADLAALGLRACQCSFCRAHNARNASDPHGAVRIKVRDGNQLNRYRFGLKTADFLICRTCGVYIGALLSEDGKDWITVNVNTLLPPPGPDAAVVPLDFGAEDTASRVDRRKSKWTPVVEFSQ